MEAGLEYNFLTLEQEIQVHYMLAALYETIPETFTPLCYHYGMGFQLMEEHALPNIQLLLNKVLIDKDKLKGQVCRNCEIVKKNESERKKFEEKYKNEYLEVDDFILFCQEASKK
jgi:hypothetical protein